MKWKFLPVLQHIFSVAALCWGSHKHDESLLVVAGVFSLWAIYLQLCLMDDQ
jgi:hypothetical protein